MAAQPERTIIRDAVPGDRPELVSLMSAFQEYERALEDNRSRGPEMAEAHVAYLEAEVAANGGFVLVAEREGQLVGFLIGFVDTMPGFIVRPEHRRYGFVTDFFLIPEARGVGAGRALMEAAEGRFGELGLSEMLLFVLAANTPAQHFYDRAGFETYERFLRKRIG